MSILCAFKAGTPVRCQTQACAVRNHAAWPFSGKGLIEQVSRVSYSVFGTLHSSLPSHLTFWIHLEGRNPYAEHEFQHLVVCGDKPKLILQVFGCLWQLHDSMDILLRGSTRLRTVLFCILEKSLQGPELDMRIPVWTRLDLIVRLHYTSEMKRERKAAECSRNIGEHYPILG